MKKYLINLSLPLFLWLVMFLTRPIYLRPWCAATPTPCQAQNVNPIDQVSFQFNSVQADFISNIVQNTMGGIALLLPWILYRNRKIALHENYFFGQAALWNAVMIEVSHALSQRPRPLVFHDPLGDGANINQYTSMFSGHTSFVAVASLSILFMGKRYFFKKREPSRIAIRLLWLQFIFITGFTGILRIWGGRHFPSDTLVGFLVGSLTGLYFQKRLKPQEY